MSKIPVPPLSKAIDINMIETPLNNIENDQEKEEVKEEIKEIIDVKKENMLNDQEKEVEETTDVTKDNMLNDQNEVNFEVKKDINYKIKEPHTPIQKYSKETKEERRRRKKEKRIRELRERGIVVRKPLRKDMKKKLKLRNLKKIPDNFDEDDKKTKPFVDRPSTPPSPQKILNTQPVFFNDAETRMSDGSDIE
jgi:t-SNARE complex subunit (syntaxin)